MTEAGELQTENTPTPVNPSHDMISDCDDGNGLNDFIVLDSTNCETDMESIESHVGERHTNPEGTLLELPQLHSPQSLSRRKRRLSTSLSPDYRPARKSYHRNRRSRSVSWSRYGRRSVRTPLHSVIIGNGHSTKLKAVNQHRNQRTAPTSNRTVTGVFVSRLAPKTTPSHVERQIKHETGLEIRAEKLETRYRDYSSFYVRGDKRIRDIVMDPGLWPSGTLIKHYYD